MKAIEFSDKERTTLTGILGNELDKIQDELTNLKGTEIAVGTEERVKTDTEFFEDLVKTIKVLIDKTCPDKDR